MEIAVFLDADNTMYSLNTDKAYKAMFKYLSEELNNDVPLIQRVWREHLINILLDEKKRRDPKFRRREHTLDLTIGQLGIKDKKKREKIIENALNIFWENIAYSVKRKRGLKKFLEFCKNNNIDVGIFTDEFYRPLSSKMTIALGKDWKKWFKYILAPEEVGVMKPSYKYYDIMLEYEKNSEKIFVIGDDWKRDLEIAKKIGNKFVTILINDEFSGNPDFFARDFYDVLKIIRENL